MNAELPAGITGATANFVVRPYDFLLSGIAERGGHRRESAGRRRVRAPCSWRPARRFARRSRCATRKATRRRTTAARRRPKACGSRRQIVAPVGGANSAVGTRRSVSARSANGVATGTDFTWSEVGIMQAVPGIGDGRLPHGRRRHGTGRASASAGSSRATSSSALNSPLFDTACSAGGFTYQGQAFNYVDAPVITATAVAVSGTTTTNYTGAFFKLDELDADGPQLCERGSRARHVGLPATTVDPAIASVGGGVATLTFGSGSGLAFVKAAPLAPFPAQVQLSIDVLDSDGVAAVGAAPLGNPVTFGIVGRHPVHGRRRRFATAACASAPPIGSERVDLPVPMRAEYYASAATGFVDNAADTLQRPASRSRSPATRKAWTPARPACSIAALPVRAAWVARPPQRSRFAIGEPPLAGGDFNLRLGAPGAGNQGSVLIRRRCRRGCVSTGTRAPPATRIRRARPRSGSSAASAARSTRARSTRSVARRRQATVCCRAVVPPSKRLPSHQPTRAHTAATPAPITMHVRRRDAGSRMASCPWAMT